MQVDLIISVWNDSQFDFTTQSMIKIGNVYNTEYRHDFIPNISQNDDETYDKKLPCVQSVALVHFWNPYLNGVS